MAPLADRERARLVQEALLGRLVPELVHQLRNPLNSILTSASLLQEQPDSDELRQRLLPVLQRSAERMRDLLNGVGEMPTRASKGGFDLRELIAAALGVMTSRRHTISVHPPDTGARVPMEGESDLLWPLLLSLFDTAFCAANTELTVTLEANNHQAVLTMAHDGQTDASAVAGSRLEASLVEHLVDALGACVAYVDGPGSMASIVLTIPAKLDHSHEVETP